MTKEEDILLSALDESPLDAGFAARVQTLARCELVPAPSGRPVVRVRMAMSGALVPALLISAAVVRTVETAKVVAEIYGTHEQRR